VIPAVVALALLGAALSLLPPVRESLRTTLLREVAVRFLDRLYATVDHRPGIARLEDPEFRHELLTARESGRVGPGRIVDDLLCAAAAFLTLAGFLGLAAAVRPGPAVLILLAAAVAAVPRLRAPSDSEWAGVHSRRAAYFEELLTSVAAAKELRLLHLGDLFRARMHGEALAADRLRSECERRELRTHTAVAVLAATLAGGGLFWGVVDVADRQLAVADLTVLLAAVVAMPLSAQALARRVRSVRHEIAAYGRFRAWEDQPDLPEAADAGPVGGLADGIELTDVWFRYAPDQPWVLRGVTLTIPCGQTVALVGLNGAGKSTLIKLLCRFYDPTLGSIRWDGRDIRHLKVEDLRSRIGAVFQDFMRYDLSAAENIGVGDVVTLGDAGRTQAAARLAGVHETVQALPAGYETRLSSSVLSGGQWQRIAMARAFLRADRDLMILDEPASGLDAYAESELHQRLRQRRVGRTSVLVSHRLGAVRDADLIVVLAEGKVAESGRHADLVAGDGGYARLFRLQATGYLPDTDREAV
jgi:ATP-binding cassette subfamily B protein